MVAASGAAADPGRTGLARSSGVADGSVVDAQRLGSAAAEMPSDPKHDELHATFSAMARHSDYGADAVVRLAGSLAPSGLARSGAKLSMTAPPGGQPAGRHADPSGRHVGF